MSPPGLGHMDQLGVDVQVMYPTLFLTQVSGRPEVEMALCKAYNRWMGSKWAQSGGRLRWIATLPLLSMDEALEEMAFAKEHGACGVLKKGRECGGRPAGDSLLPSPVPRSRQARHTSVLPSRQRRSRLARRR